MKSYSVMKLQLYNQENRGTNTFSQDEGFEFKARVDASSSNTVSATILEIPGGFSINLNADPDGTKLDFTANESRLDFLNAEYPQGSYTFRFTGTTDGQKSASLELEGDIYPAIPVFLNPIEAQSINPDQSFTFEWAFPEGTAADYIQLRIDDLAGNKFYDTPNLGKTKALNGLSTSNTIPAGKLALGSVYNARLFFLRAPKLNTSGYPGAVGFSGFARETMLQIKTRAKMILPTSLDEQGFQFAIQGPSGTSVDIESSLDLKVWRYLGETKLNGIDDLFVDKDSIVSNRFRFYRLVLKP